MKRVLHKKNSIFLSTPLIIFFFLNLTESMPAKKIDNIFILKAYYLFFDGQLYIKFVNKIQHDRSLIFIS